ncbi:MULTISPECIES: AprI/Inh family metalloprotease inhibitor [unclassified Devosia]|uniref:AprI/Inh family metalloprotease inhibitor n=1 Tax=unclassified Devosia TaxID=196773 RepID=UPI0015549106|nr:MULTISPECIES: AprI/Inh family metalloprotease inhibitor [unclassified Devosia]
MAAWMRGSVSAAGLAAVALLMAGCSSTSNTANLNTIGAPAQLQPVQPSSVQQSTLPALGGATGAPAPGLSGQPVLGGVPSTPPGMAGGVSSLPPVGASTQTASNSSFVTLGPNGAAPAAPGGFTAGPEGVWTVQAGPTQCRLNLPMTAKTGTSYYRASAPGCGVPGLASVGGWQQVGSQLQLYDENGNIAAFLAPSGGRYIGTLGGGQAISMQR